MLDIHDQNDIRTITLARPPVNALDPGLVRALREALAAVPGVGARGIVLAGRPGLFSAGLDLPVLLSLERAQFRVFWRDFFGLCSDLATSPVPIAAALTGHSPAGGAVLAILCDYRVMARGDFRIGLNETQVGLVVPEVIQAALRRLVGTHRAERLMVAGTMRDPDAALAEGFVDELAEPDAVVARAIERVARLLALPPRAMSGTRELARADLVALYAEPGRLPMEDFLDHWYHPETQSTLRAVVAKLKSKR